MFQSLFRLSVLCLIIIGCSKNNPDGDNNLPDNPENSIKNGLDTSLLDIAAQNASKAENFQALYIVKNGEVMVEEYFNGNASDTKFHLRSITKNITSVLVGIAIEDGVLDGLDYGIKELYQDLLIGEKESLTIRNLLNMTAGLPWDEQTEVLDLIEGRMSNPIENLLSRALESEPGSTFNYNTLLTHLTGEIIGRKSNSSMADYANSKLFIPLDIGSFEWEKDLEGNVWGGTGLQLTMEDLAKFGQLFLDKGRWDGEQLVSQEWIEQSSTVQLQIPQSSSGYSLHWYVADNLDKKVVFGQGYGGQYLMLIPDENMMIIAAQEHLVTYSQNTQQSNNFLNNVFPVIYQSIQ
ncbi:serine hydrolase domain-containing protein [Flagellimonas myxillae]|uniref:serine hydrolase domain-containing protein n=1 Tax=Flagellimonas myxillae TaxID=2942214 RepID=UPI00201EC6D4|nr:serine hydrolase [Muricauda myxillae]MCL6265489.1 beta-lactamase family protein [Muricauda myxillae]